jgi:hypothetical protein
MIPLSSSMYYKYDVQRTWFHRSNWSCGQSTVNSDGWRWGARRSLCSCSHKVWW